MGELEDYFRHNTGRLISKWRHYFGIYERHFAPYRNRPVRIVEFGVWHGGSLQMWRRYFGPEAQIVGVDINPECARLSEPGVEIVIGDQADPATHRALRSRFGEFDIVIDDGGHRMDQQVTTFRELYPAVKVGGLYVAEDLHTSYHPDFGGGLRRAGTFIELGKQLIDQLHAWYGPPAGLEVDYVTRTAYGLHFYDSMLVVEKGRVEAPRSEYSGAPAVAMGVAELRFLAFMDVEAGRPAEALDKYRRALAASPDDAELRERVRALESALR